MLQDLVHEIEETARDIIKNEVHTALPGKIISFNASKCVAVVQPIGKYVTSNGKKLSYPKITDAPVMFPYSTGSKSGIAFPIKKNDRCLVLISEVELDEWRNGSVSDCSLKFDLTSGIVIPGLLQKSNTLIQKAQKEGTLCLGYDGVVASMGKDTLKLDGDVKLEGEITIKGNLSVTGNAEIAKNLTVRGTLTSEGLNCTTAKVKGDLMVLGEIKRTE